MTLEEALFNRFGIQSHNSPSGTDTIKETVLLPHLVFDIQDKNAIY
jgi:hypothetical protein